MLSPAARPGRRSTFSRLEASLSLVLLASACLAQACDQGCDEQRACDDRSYTRQESTAIPTMCGVESEVFGSWPQFGKIGYQWTMAKGRCRCQLDQGAGVPSWSQCGYGDD